MFESSLLLAGPVAPLNVQRQLSRWTASGRLLQLRRELYALSPPYQNTPPHPFLVANRLVRPSYLSCQAALVYHGMILESVPISTSVTTGRPGRRETPLGPFLYHHLGPRQFFGFALRGIGQGQAAFVAGPEKALLDLIYLTPGGDSEDYLEGLRLQRLDQLRPTVLAESARRFDKPKLWRAIRTIGQRITGEEGEYEPL